MGGTGIWLAAHQLSAASCHLASHMQWGEGRSSRCRGQDNRSWKVGGWHENTVHWERTGSAIACSRQLRWEMS